MKKNACLLWKALFLGLILMITSGNNIFAQGGFNSLYAVQDPSSGNYVLIDSTGRIVTNTGLPEMNYLGEGITAFYIVDEYCEENCLDLHLYNATGNEIASFNNINIGLYSHFYNGLMPFGNDYGKYGYLNTLGEIAIDSTLKVYDFIGDFHEGLARLNEEYHKYGFIDHTGQYTIPPQYDWAGDFHSGRAIVSINHNNFVINHKGEVDTKFNKFAIVSDFNDKGLCQVGNEKKNEKIIIDDDDTYTIYYGNVGLMDTSGHWVIEPKYKEMKEQSDGNWLVATASNIPCCIFCDDNEQGNGISKCKGLKWELIDPLGHTLIVIPPRFDDEGNPIESEFHEIQTSYYTNRMTDGKYAIQDCYGKELFGRHFNEIKHSYSIPGYFHVIENDGREVIIDRQGRKVIDVPQAPVVQRDQGEESYVSCLWEKNGLFCFQTEVIVFENEWDDMVRKTSMTIINRQGKVIWKTPLK